MDRQREMTDKNKSDKAYVQWLEKDLGKLIDELDLSDLQKQMLKTRWLDQVTWFERRSIRDRKRYYVLRLTAIIGGILIPVCVTVNQAQSWPWLPGIATFLGVLVAIASAVEELFSLGKCWRNYRNTAELLKIEGWQFFQLSGPYGRRKSLAEAYEKFAARVEEIIQRDVQIYISDILGEQEPGRETDKDEGE